MGRLVENILPARRSRAEYVSNVIAFLQVARRTGAVVEVVEDDAYGQLSVDDLRSRLADDRSGPVCLVAVTHVPTSGLDRRAGT